MQRYRSGWERNRGEEFDAPFDRIDRMGPDRFDIYWMRHTGKWWRLHAGVTLADALRLLETDGVLHPAWLTFRLFLLSMKSYRVKS